MVNLKLIIPIVVVVVVVIAVVLLLLPGLTGGGTTTETGTSPTATQTTTGGPSGKPTGGTQTVQYSISVNAKIREPNAQEQSQGILKVVEFDYRISVIGTVQIKEIKVEVGNKNYTLVSYATPLAITNRQGYKIPLKLEIKTQQDLDIWKNAKKAKVYTILIVQGKEEVDTRVVLLTQFTTTRSVPVPGGGII